MGRTIRRQPVTNNIPTAPKKYYFNITAFKGISRTDNPFNEDTSTCSDALNVYVDEDNALSTRPRTEVKYNLTNITNFKKAISLTFIDEKYLLQYYTTDDKAHICWVSTNGTVTPITGEVGTSKIEIRKGKGYYVFVDGVSYKYIDATTNVVSEASEHAYIPLVSTGGDLYTGTYGEIMQSTNILTSAEKHAFGATLQTQEEILGITYDALPSATNYTVVTENNNRKTVTNKKDINTVFDVDPRVPFTTPVSEVRISRSGKCILKRNMFSSNYGASFHELPMIPEGAMGISTAVYNEIFAIVYCINENNVKKFVLIDSADEFKTYNKHEFLFSTLNTNDYNVYPNYKQGVLLTEHYLYLWMNAYTDDGYCRIYGVCHSRAAFSSIDFSNSNFLNLGTLTTDKSNFIPRIDLQDNGATASVVMTTYTKDLNLSQDAVATPIPTTRIGTSVNSCAFSPIEAGVVYYTYYDNNATTTVYKYKNGNVETLYNDILVSRGNIVCANNYIMLLNGNENAYGTLGEIFDITNSTWHATVIFPSDWVLPFESLAGTAYYAGWALGNTICISYQNYLFTNKPFKVKTDFIEIQKTYTDYDSNILTQINTATHLIDFNNTLFIGGNSNLICHTDVDANTFENNYLYLPMKNRAYIGTNDDKITSFNMLSDTGMLAYTKDNVYIIYYDATNKVYTYNKTKTPYGHISNRNATTTPISDTPIIINNNGVFAFQAVANYQTTDKSSVLISEAINPILFKETQLDKTFMCNHKYWTLLFVPNGNITKVYLLDDRTQQFFYWELYGKVIDAIEIDGDVNLLTEDGYVLTFTTEDIYKQYGALEKTVYYDVYNTESVRIPWEWESQILPLSTINYLKTLVNTSFMVSDSDESDNYGFSFVLTSFKRRANYNTSEKTLKENLQGIKSRTIRTPITRFNFLRLNLSNMEDDSQHDYTKLRLVGIALKYRLLEMNQ